MVLCAAHSRYHSLMNPLPHTLYSAQQVRELDRRAIEEQGMPGIDLMERAGQAAYSALRRRWPRARNIGVLCGVGNNGGDGFILARLAHDAGLAVTVWQVGDKSRIHGDALSARERMTAAGLEDRHYDGEDLSVHEVLVDGLLGTGLSGEVVKNWLAAIESINNARARGAKVLALDIPSGLHADSGAELGVAVQADCTVTFIGLKSGLFTGRGPALCGEVVFDSLGVPEAVYKDMSPMALRLVCPDVGGALPPREADANKGRFGHVLVVGGELGMSGALRMAAEAAARVGAGLISAATRRDHAALVSALRPEIMSHGVEEPAGLNPLLQRATVVAVGPGLGQGQWGRAMLGKLLESGLPMVVDADALNLLAQEPLTRDNWILTPHPGEAARLLQTSVGEIQSDRIAATQALQERFAGVVVLKGAGTVIVDADAQVAICSEGNPGMASGGMGDVLTGVIAGLFAQGMGLAEAARLGVCLHARAADEAAKDGLRGLLATDLLPILRRLVG
jgi:NAD(P)H-hydrate epimerase